MTTIILTCEFYNNVHLFVPKVPPFKTKKIDLQKLKDYLNKVKEDEEIMNQSKRPPAMDFDIRYKLIDDTGKIIPAWNYGVKGKWRKKNFGNTELHCIYGRFDFSPYWEEIRNNDFSILYGDKIKTAQFRLEIKDEFRGKNLTFDRKKCKYFYDKDEFTLVNEENWEFDDECQFSEDDDCDLHFILDDPKRAAVFKKDRSGFPILLTDLK